jgi:hypothetical protein
MIEELKNILRKIKKILVKWLPKDITEIILYTISIILIVLIVNLFHFSNINRRVRRESRCYREQNESVVGKGIYKVTAVSTIGDDIYEVIYDIESRTYNIVQKCEEGTIQNKVFIRVYDLNRRSVDKIEKIFLSNKNYELNLKLPYFKGDPGLVRFMEYGTTDFFDGLPI